MFNLKGLRPYCKICGWRKGGVDSWNGVACKCGHTEPPTKEAGVDAIKEAMDAAVRDVLADRL